MNSSLISIVINAYNAQAALERQLAHWAGFAPEVRARLEVVIVDDGSAQPLFVEPGQLPQGLRFTLARIEEDIAWNMPGARNLGALLARSPFLLMHDIDHFLSGDGVALLQSHLHQLSAKTLYNFPRELDGERINPPVNCFLCSRDGFWQVGGYDEDFAGAYGHEDGYFLRQWRERVGDMLMLTDLHWEVQPRFATQHLSRDTTRNSALYRQKVATPPAPATTRLRFPWTVQVLAS